MALQQIGVRYVTCNPSNRKIFLTAAGYNSGDVAYVTVEYIK